MADDFYKLARIEKLTRESQYMSIPVEIRRVECQLGRIIPCDGAYGQGTFRGWIGERLRVGVLLSRRFLGKHS